MSHRVQPVPRRPSCAGMPPVVAQNGSVNQPDVPALDVVVCRYAEDVASWLPRLVKGAAANVRAVVINHGPTPALPAQALSTTQGGHLYEWRTPNAGNECGCYLLYIACRYPHFAPLTLFLQADAGSLGCLCQPALPFAYLGRNEWRSMVKGDTDRTCRGYNDRSCHITSLFGEKCERSGRGLELVGPGHANLQVARPRLLRHPHATWQRLAALVDGSHARFGEQLCSNRGRTRWFDCLVMERLWHRMMGEPGVLPRELALPWLPPAARCNGTCALPCPPEPECTARIR